MYLILSFQPKRFPDDADTRSHISPPADKPLKARAKRFDPVRHMRQLAHRGCPLSTPEPFPAIFPTLDRTPTPFPSPP